MCPEVFGGAEEQQGLSPGARSLAPSGAAHLRTNSRSLILVLPLTCSQPGPGGSPAGWDSTGLPWLPFPGSQSRWNPSQCQASRAAPLSNFQIRHLGSRRDWEAGEGRLVISYNPTGKAISDQPQTADFPLPEMARGCDLFTFEILEIASPNPARLMQTHELKACDLL